MTLYPMHTTLIIIQIFILRKKSANSSTHMLPFSYQLQSNSVVEASSLNLEPQSLTQHIGEVMLSSITPTLDLGKGRLVGGAGVGCELFFSLILCSFWDMSRIVSFLHLTWHQPVSETAGYLYFTRYMYFAHRSD